MATLQDILGGGLPPGLLTPEQEVAAVQRAQNAGLLNFAFGALQASRGQPGQRAPSLAQVIGQAGPVGVAGYQQSFDQTLNNLLRGFQIRSAVAEANAPKYMTLKTPAGGEMIIQIPRGGGEPTPVNIPGMPTTKPIEFDDQTRAFIDLKFAKPYDQLTQNEKREVLQFANAPNDEKITSLRIEAEKQGFETGIRTPIPRGRAEMIGAPPVTISPVAPTTPATTVAPAAPRAAPAVAPVTPTVSPVVAPAEPTEPRKVTQVSKNLALPVDMAVKPLGVNEVPLVQSSGITPKQKSQLELERPQSFAATEYSLNQIRETRNTIRQLLADPNFDLAFGFGGETLSNIYTPAADVRAKLESLRDQQFARNITAMRDASKTGAAVGNVTQQEGPRFENMQGSLKQFQSAKQARSTLERIEKELSDSETRIENSFSRYYGPSKFSVIDLYTAPAKTKTLEEIFLPKRK